MSNGQMEQFSYNNKIVRQFSYATILWGMVGFSVGLLLALQLVLPALNFEISWLTFGRLRPLHTNAVIFAFVGNAMFAGIYYSLQRLCKARMYSDVLSAINFWGWQAIIVSAAITLPLGITTGKEYAELEWPIDIAITVIWVVFGWNMFATILKRRVSHLYVSIWFYIASFVTVAVLHLVNSVALPIGLFKSYSWYAGVQDALVQWWYGHNAVAFFLTTPFLGLMYYFIPKAANRPVYSYRLSIIHFWSLIFIYIWAGPHHLLYTALPDWAQSLGVVFSIMLIAPSWGGMLNGLLTLRGAWDKVRESAVLKFMVVAVTAYGMATFEGPMMALKNVNAISHFTDWTVAHVHVGALGWNGFLTFGMMYFLIPKMFNTKLYSQKLANTHFWLGTLGIIIYTVPMYFAGIMQSLMWKEFNPDGSLAYPNFLETLTEVEFFYWARAFGGTIYIVGAIVMLVNLRKTIASGTFTEEEKAEAPALSVMVEHEDTKEHWHRWIEKKPVQLMVGSLVVILIGGMVEMVPTFLVESNVKSIASVKPYTPLELEGRDIYIREGCHNCHSQMIRPFRSETARYGEYSKAGEFVYDHPFQWGSKRTGPDLAREGVSQGEMFKKNNTWHFQHLYEPSSLSPGTIMPSYKWLVKGEVDVEATVDKINAMRTLGVPYAEGYENEAVEELEAQANMIISTLTLDEAEKAQITNHSEMIALIGYLQRLGTDIIVEK